MKQFRLNKNHITAIKFKDLIEFLEDNELTIKADQDKIYIIDTQPVTKEHPDAVEALVLDIDNGAVDQIPCIFETKLVIYKD